MKKQWIEAGEIVTTHGVKGEVKLMPWTDGPEFLKHFTRVSIDGTDYDIERCRVQNTCNIMKLKGVDTMEQGQALRGKTPLLYREDAPEGLVFSCELIGMEVYAGDAFLGKLTDVLDYPGNKVYVVKGEKEFMIPAVKQFVLNTDMDGNRMDIMLIEGMETDAD